MATSTAQRAASGLPVLRRQRVRVPWRLAGSRAYSDAALAVYVKIAALAQRPEGCTAGVDVLAGYLAMSRSTVERAITQLHRPRGGDQVAEVVTRRRTHRGGRGRTAHRTVRQPDSGEHFVWLPVTAAEALAPRMLRLYAALAYATGRRIPITAAELAELLGVTGRSVRTLIGRLEALGWCTVHRRAGAHGRHLYTVHEHPLQPALPVSQPHAPPEAGDGSGADLGDGSPAIRKTKNPTDDDDAEASCGPAARRQLPVARDLLPEAAACHTAPPAPRAAPYTGPELTLSPRVWAALEPVRDLLPDLSPWALRRAAREVGAQLDAGATAARLTARIERRRARLDGRPADPGAWLLAAALPRWGCGLEVCEDGWLYRPWAPGPPVPCEVCPGAREHTGT